MHICNVLDQGGDMSKKPIGTLARTGGKCPESGVWRSVETPSTTVTVAEGNSMPRHDAKAVTWRLIRHP
ncbi:hypothetical protein SAMN05446935_7347 [Burkholderia sp. YR290]|nr:hypothetical protein SAMN05446935_7347 [Burkholderia sp. YR290]